MHRVKSSQIHSISYEPADGTLRCAFHCPCNPRGAGDPKEGCSLCGGRGHKGIYTYQAVPAAYYVEIRDAVKNGKSTGTVFNALIKKGGYRFDFAPHSAHHSA